MNKLLLIVLACATAIAAPPARIKSLTCPKALMMSPTGIGQIGTCVITLTGKAPRKGATFRISVNSDKLIIPPTTVTVPSGQTSAAFQIKQKDILQQIASE